MNVQLTNKREVIFLSAIDLIQEHGFHGTPMSQIAKHANVSVGTVYHYFESKEELIMNLFQYCDEKVSTFIFDGADENLAYEVRFKRIWKRFVAFHTANPTIFRFMEQYFSSPFHETERLRKENRSPDSMDIYSFLKKGILQQELKQLNAQVLCSAYLGVATSFIRAIIFGKVALEQQQIEDLAEIVWKSIKSENI